MGRLTIPRRQAEILAVQPPWQDFQLRLDKYQARHICSEEGIRVQDHLAAPRSSEFLKLHAWAHQMPANWNLWPGLRGLSSETSSRLSNSYDNCISYEIPNITGKRIDSRGALVLTDLALFIAQHEIARWVLPHQRFDLQIFRLAPLKARPTQPSWNRAMLYTSS